MIDDDVRVDINAGKQKVGRNHASSFDEEKDQTPTDNLLIKAGEKSKNEPKKTN